MVEWVTGRGRAVPFEEIESSIQRPCESFKDLDLNSIVAGFVVSSVGFVLFQYGRKMSRAPHVVCGLVLMVFPYFVPSVLVAFGIAALLCALLYLAVRY